MSSLTLLQSLHESLSTRAQVASVFGDPIVAGDKTIIPVAKIAYGFGGGTGSGGLEIKTARGEGGGGGGGVGAFPIGVFEVGPQGARFGAVGAKKKVPMSDGGQASRPSRSKDGRRRPSSISASPSLPAGK